MKYKLIKTMAQVCSIFAPIIYWNCNFDSMTLNEGYCLVVGGILVSLLIQLIYYLTTKNKSSNEYI